MTEQRRIDTSIPIRTGQTVDLGWGFLRLNEDQTVTRTCKGCQGTVTTSARINVGVLLAIIQKGSR